MMKGSTGGRAVSLPAVSVVFPSMLTPPHFSKGK